MRYSETIFKAVLGGLAISMGGFANLTVGGVAGAIMFAFGLSTIILSGWSLYTGIAGEAQPLRILALVLLFNVIGVFTGAFIAYEINPDLVAAAGVVCSKKLEASFLNLICGGIGCGFIMTCCCRTSRAGNFIPLLLGVPLFILTGMHHSIADAFYYSLCIIGRVDAPILKILFVWAVTVVANFAGCNLPNIQNIKKNGH